MESGPRQRPLPIRLRRDLCMPPDPVAVQRSSLQARSLAGCHTPPSVQLTKPLLYCAFPRSDPLDRPARLSEATDDWNFSITTAFNYPAS